MFTPRSAERARPAWLRRCTCRCPTPASAASAGAGRPSRPGSRPSGRCRSRSPGGTASWSSTMPRSWPPRPMVLGKMICASMPHSSRTSSRTFGSYAPTWISSIDHWLSADVGALLLAVAADDRRPRWPARGRGRRTPTCGSPSTSSTRGTRSLYSGGATLVKRSCGSVQCESASMTSVRCPAWTSRLGSPHGSRNGRRTVPSPTRSSATGPALGDHTGRPVQQGLPRGPGAGRGAGRGEGNQVLIWDRPNCGASDVCFTGASESAMQADTLAALAPRTSTWRPRSSAAARAASRVSLLTAPPATPTSPPGSRCGGSAAARSGS